MGSYSDSDLIQLEVKLKNEVGRLHPENNARRGAIELESNEAEILLELVQKARAFKAPAKALGS